MGLFFYTCKTNYKEVDVQKNENKRLRVCAIFRIFFSKSRKYSTVELTRKNAGTFFDFVHTYPAVHGIIITVKPPNTLYSFCYTP